MREHQIVISLKSEDFQQVQKMARAAGAKSVGAYIRQRLMSALELKNSDAGSEDPAGPNWQIISGQIRRLHRELQVFIAESNANEDYTDDDDFDDEDNFEDESVPAYAGLEVETVEKPAPERKDPFDPATDSLEQLADKAFAISPRLGSLESGTPIGSPIKKLGDPLSDLLEDKLLIPQSLDADEDDEDLEELDETYGQTESGAQYQRVDVSRQLDLDVDPYDQSTVLNEQAKLLQEQQEIYGAPTDEYAERGQYDVADSYEQEDSYNAQDDYSVQQSSSLEANYPVEENYDVDSGSEFEQSNYEQGRRESVSQKRGGYVDVKNRVEDGHETDRANQPDDDYADDDDNVLDQRNEEAERLLRGANKAKAARTTKRDARVAIDDDDIQKLRLPSSQVPANKRQSQTEEDDAGNLVSSNDISHISAANDGAEAQQQAVSNDSTPPNPPPVSGGPPPRKRRT